MVHVRLRAISILTLTVTTFWMAPAPIAQEVPHAQRPTFAGTWAPSDPAKSDELFDSGLGWVPGNGRLIIEQRPDRLTVTKRLPDDRIDPFLDINGQFSMTVVYRIVEPRGRSGGFGAAGDQRPTSWQGGRLVLLERWGTRPYTLALSLDGDRLKLETYELVSQAPRNDVAEWFTRVK
jgi:hypothetical protein